MHDKIQQELQNNNFDSLWLIWMFDFFIIFKIVNTKKKLFLKIIFGLFRDPETKL